MITSFLYRRSCQLLLLLSYCGTIIRIVRLVLLLVLVPTLLLLCLLAYQFLRLVLWVVPKRYPVLSVRILSVIAGEASSLLEALWITQGLTIKDHWKVPVVEPSSNSILTNLQM